MTRPYAVPTVLTSLFRTPETIREGDGVVLVWPDGSQRHGIVVARGRNDVSVTYPGGPVRAELKWEESE